jgi:hypothetical protein
MVTGVNAEEMTEDESCAKRGKEKRLRKAIRHEVFLSTSGTILRKNKK